MQGFLRDLWFNFKFFFGIVGLGEPGEIIKRKQEAWGKHAEHPQKTETQETLG